VNRKSKKTIATNAWNRVTFQGILSAVDGEGGYDNTWIDIATVWAEINAITAIQKLEYKSIDVDATHRVMIRGRFTANGSCKIVDDTWTITWSGIVAGTVLIEYQVNGGSWETVILAAPNTGSYDWTIPTDAIGQNVVCRISGN